jgi:hypothetical protein
MKTVEPTDIVGSRRYITTILMYVTVVVVVVIFPMGLGFGVVVVKPKVIIFNRGRRGRRGRILVIIHVEERVK